MSELAFLLLLFSLPAAIGFYLAKRRGKNPFLWGLLSGIFPFFLVVLKMQHKPLDKKIEPTR
jgi:Kef-type K+ transport system membrane component KefB